MLNNSGHSDIPILFLIFRGKYLVFYQQVQCDVTCEFFIDALYQAEEVLYSCFAECAYHERVIDLSNAYSMSIKPIMWGLCFILLL